MLVTDVPLKYIIIKREEKVTTCESKGFLHTAILGTFRNSKGLELISTILPLLRSI